MIRLESLVLWILLGLYVIWLLTGCQTTRPNYHTRQSVTITVTQEGPDTPQRYDRHGNPNFGPRQ